MSAPDAALTADPPAEALAWMTAIVGPGARVVSVAPLSGARSSAVHGVVVELPSGRAERLVLRRHVDRDWLTREPDLAEREAEVLAVLESGNVPAPRLVGVDGQGDESDVPSVLMSWLGGQPSSRRELRGRLDDLAALLPRVHATVVPIRADVRLYRPYFTGGDDPGASELVPPAGSARPELWERAIGLHRAWVHPGDGGLVHRDFHPGNVLFSGARLTGLVDWANASIGPPDVDVGHCRANLASALDVEAADHFRGRWLAEAGLDHYDPMGDILAVVGLLPYQPVWFTGAEARLEELVASALAELSAG